MEKLFIRVIFLCIGTLCTYGQDSLCVFKFKGTSLLEIESKKRALNKGDFISKNNVLQVLPSAEVTTIDSYGNVYTANVPGTYALKDLLNFKADNQKSSFTAQYFKHIWNELRSSDGNKTLIAGVFRGDILMSSPPDKAKIGSSRIALRWDTSNESVDSYFVFVRNPITDDILKIETNGSELALFNDNPIFYDSDLFEWTVSTESFPNLNNIPFYSFSLVDRNTFSELTRKYADFVSDLKNLGMNDSEISEVLCRTYGLCK